MKVSRSLALSFSVAAVVLLGCSRNADEREWGAAAEAFFSEWTVAWSGSDSYDIVRFYDSDVAVALAEDYRSLSLNAGYIGTAVGGHGRAWMVDWINAQFVPKDRSLDAVYVGGDRAAAVTTIAEINAVSGVSLTMGEMLIDGYTDLRWRDAHLDGGAPDPRLDWLDELVQLHITAWTSGDRQSLESRYAPEATIESFPNPPLPIADTAMADALQFADGRVATVTSGNRSGDAVFVSPGIAAYVLDAETDDGCSAQYMIVWTMEDQLIIRENRLPTPDTVRRCLAVEAPNDGWWNAVEPPLPVGEQVTGAIAERDGTEIRVFNGSDELEHLLEWGLSRFEEAGLVRPELASATFAPLPICASVPGLVTEVGENRADLILCTDAHRACVPDRETCSGFRLDDRLGMLHELGHAWLLQNLSLDAEAGFLSITGLDSWADGGIPWHQRGAEQAAEILAWGLLDEPITLARIGEPPCEVAVAGFRALTGEAPLRSCG